MNIDSYDILVIALGVALAIFLVLATVLTTYLIKIVKDIRQITKKAGSVVDGIEAVGKVAASKGPASFISSIIASVAKNSTKCKDKESKDER